MAQYPDPYDVQVAFSQLVNGAFCHGLAIAGVVYLLFMVALCGYRFWLRVLLADSVASSSRCVPARRSVPVPLTLEQQARLEAEAELDAYLVAGLEE